jgi:5S rRNA maturation endonuclease (ribonuclease M5)
MTRPPDPDDKQPSGSTDGAPSPSARLLAKFGAVLTADPLPDATAGKNGHADPAGAEHDPAVASARILRDLSREPKPRIVATYPYVDEHGELLYEVVRYNPKDFRQRRPNGSGGWIWSLDKDAAGKPLPTPTRRVLFHLPALIAGMAEGDGVYVVEGEKDVLAIEAAGAVATCNSGGAAAEWLPEFSGLLRDAAVIVVADRDKAGRKHAAQVAASLRAEAASVVVVEAAAGKDAADHLAAGFGLDDFLPVDEPDEETQPRTKPAEADGQKTREGEGPEAIHFESLAEFFDETPDETPYIVEGLLAEGSINDFSGPPKVGKTQLTVALVAALVHGDDFLGLATRQCNVVYLYEEPKASFREKLAAVGIDPERDNGRLTLLHRSAARGRDWPTICAALRLEMERTGAMFGVVDTWSKWTQLPATQEYDPGTVAQVISYLQEIADDTGAAIWWSRHEGKGKAGAPLIERGRGSSAIPGEADCCFSISRVSGKGHATRRQVEYEGRFTAIPEARVMDFNDGVYALVSEGTAAETRAPEKQAALRFLRDHVPTDSDISVADLLEIENAPKKSLLHVALNEGVAHNWLTRSGEGKRNDPHRYRRNAPPEFRPDSENALDETDAVSSTLQIATFDDLPGA